MKIYIDSDTNTLISDPNFKVPLQGVTFKRGDSATVELIFVTGFTPISATANLDLRFGAKLPGVYDGDFIVYENTYVKSGYSYVMHPSFNTTTINALLGSGVLSAADVASVTTNLEITWSPDGLSSWASSNIIPLVINNDIIKGIEGTPLSLSGNPTTWLQDDALPEYITFKTGAVLEHDTNDNITFGKNIQTHPNTSNSIFLGNAAGVGATESHDCNFFGLSAGAGATDIYNSNCIGRESGVGALYATDSNFFGMSAGAYSTDALNSNFLGYQAGYQATYASDSNFLGYQAGLSAKNTKDSNFLGYQSGYQALYASDSNFLGYQAGYQATNAADSNFLGYQAGKNIVTGAKNICIGSNTGANTTALSAISGCIILGDSAKATASNQLVLGSATTPLSVIAGGSLTSSLSGLKVNINGTIYTIPLLA